MDEDISRRSISITVSAGKLTARALAQGLFKLLAMGKAHRDKKQAQPKGRQSLKKLARRYSPSKVEFSGATKVFDRIVKQNHLEVDYAFFRTGPTTFDLFFSGPSTDQIDTAIKLYIKEVLGKKRGPRIPDLLKKFGEKARAHNRNRQRTREASLGDR